MVVEYAKKKMTLQYIGVVTALDDDPDSDEPVHVKFFRRVKGSDDKFYEPDPSDEDDVSADMIIKVLSKPSLHGTG